MASCAEAAPGPESYADRGGGRWDEAESHAGTSHGASRVTHKAFGLCLVDHFECLKDFKAWIVT